MVCHWLCFWVSSACLFIGLIGCFLVFFVVYRSLLMYMGLCWLIFHGNLRYMYTGLFWHISAASSLLTYFFEKEKKTIDYGIVQGLDASPNVAFRVCRFLITCSWFFFDMFLMFLWKNVSFSSQATASSTVLMPCLQVPGIIEYMYIFIHMIYIYIHWHTLHRRLRHRRQFWCLACKCLR